MLDTPGTLWPKFDNERVAARLCFIGSVKDDVVDLYEVSNMLLAELAEQYPNNLAERYKLSLDGKTTGEIFQDIAVKRGFLLRGGEIDYDRCSKAILDDFRKGKIGKTTLDLPKDIV